jgi:hypothetical protein
MEGHRPFWVLRHRVTGETKMVAYPSCEDGLWQVCLTDGSIAAAVTYQQAKVAGSKIARRKARPKVVRGTV